MKIYDFAYYLTDYLTVYMPHHRNATKNTILSYRDTFSELMRFCQDERGISPDKLRLSKLDSQLIEDFLLWLESSLGVSVSTRNQRMGAIRSFYRYLQIKSPEHLLLCQGVLALRSKRREKPIIRYLSRDEMQCLLSQPNGSDWNERRDLALLSVLYDSAARVSEICDVTIGDVKTNNPATIKLTGKWRKTRIVPLSSSVSDLLKQYVSERNLDSHGTANKPLFTNRQGNKLTRGGISYILSKYLDRACIKEDYALPQNLTPHDLRHSKAMHMLESGINLIYIRDFLGHEDVKTTQVYARANPETKRIAIEKANADSTTQQLPAWQDNPDLMRFLKSLG